MFDKLAVPLVWISVISYIVELQLGSANSLSGPVFFLWLERLIAGWFTVEYIWRAKNGPKYIFSGFGFIDLLSIIPFWVGFFVPVNWTGIIRALRVLRMGKLFKYSRSLQLVTLSFQQAMPRLKALLMCFLLLGILNSVIIHELEKNVQPDAFGRVSSCFYFYLVAASTVGFGDMSCDTDAGKFVTCFLLLIPALCIYAAIVGVISDAFSKVIDEDLDPDFDPLNKIGQNAQLYLNFMEINMKNILIVLAALLGLAASTATAQNSVICNDSWTSSVIETSVIEGPITVTESTTITTAQPVWIGQRFVYQNTFPRASYAYWNSRYNAQQFWSNSRQRWQNRPRFNYSRRCR